VLYIIIEIIYIIKNKIKLLKNKQINRVNQKFKQYAQEKSFVKKLGFLIVKKSIYVILGFVFLYSKYLFILKKLPSLNNLTYSTKASV